MMNEADTDKPADDVGKSACSAVLACSCGQTDDVKPVQFRNGWGSSANGYFSEVHNLCKQCRNMTWGTWRNAR